MSRQKQLLFSACHELHDLAIELDIAASMRKRMNFAGGVRDARVHDVGSSSSVFPTGIKPTRKDYYRKAQAAANLPQKSNEAEDGCARDRAKAGGRAEEIHADFEHV